MEITISCSKLSGDFTRKISVETNDPSHPKETLTCKGRIMEPVTLKPKRANFGQVSRTAPGQKRTIMITPGDAGPLKLMLTPVISEFFEAELRETEAGKRYELEVTLKTPLPAKAVRTNLKIETGLAEAPHITILAMATPRPHVVASPRRFTVPRQRKADWQQTVRLEWDDDAPHRILSAAASNPGLKVKVIEKDGQQEIVLKVSEDYKPRPGAMAVTVRTDDTEARTVRVPVYFPRKAASRATRRPSAASLQSAKPKSNKITDRGAKARKTPSPPAKPPAPTRD